MDKKYRFAAGSSKGSDAGKVGIGVAAGALVGAIAGGRKGMAIGSAVGAGGGVAAVLATGGDGIRLDAGRRFQVELAEPLTVAVSPAAVVSPAGAPESLAS